MKLTGLAIAAALLVYASAASQSADDAKLRQWVRDLDSDRFQVREAASKQLRGAGPAAFPLLAEAAVGTSGEVTLRAVAILRDATRSADPAVVAAARKAVRVLVRSGNPLAANRAKVVLSEALEQIALVLEHGGVQVQRQGNIIASVRVDGADVPVAYDQIPDDRPPTLDDRLFGAAQPRLMQQLYSVTELNLFTSQFRDDGISLFRHFPNLRRVPMGLTNVTDAGLVHLKKFKNLSYVGLRGDKVTDAGLVHLAELTNLTGLNLAQTSVTDAGLVHVKGLNHMQMLILYQTAISNAGLDCFHGMPELISIDTTNTRVTAAGLARLREKCVKLRLQP